MTKTAAVRRLEARVSELEARASKDLATIKDIVAQRDHALEHAKELTQILNEMHGGIGLLTDGFAGRIGDAHKRDYDKRMKHMTERSR